MMKFWFSIILSVWMPVMVIAQEAEMFTLRGKVVDEATGQPLPYATVALVKLPDTEKILKGVVTDQKGDFELKARKDYYRVIVRNLGYRNFSKSLSLEMAHIIELGRILMKVQPEILDVITVKPLVEVSVDEIKYNLMNDPDRETSSLYDILDKVPMIHRLPMGKIYVEEMGKKFLVVRNGKVDALFSGNLDDALKSIPAKGFATITVQLAPPERYGEYDYVVNIETDKNNRLFGAVGTLRGEGNFESGVFKPEVSVLTSIDKFRMTLGGDFQNMNSPRSTQIITKQQAGEELIFRQEKRSESSGEEWQTGGYFSYDLAKQHFLTWRLAYAEKYSRDKSGLSGGYEEEEPEMTDFIKRKNNYRWRGEVSYQYDGTKSQVLNVAYYISSFSEKRLDMGKDAQQLIEDQASEKQMEQAVQIHYYNPFNRFLKLETGGGYLYRHYFSENCQFSGHEEEPSGMNTLMKTGMHIMNAYLTLHYTKKRLSASVGLKTDYLSDGEGTRIETAGNQEMISEEGFSFMPDVRMSLLFPKSKLSRLTLNYQLWNHRPSLKMLSVYEDISNPVFIRVGNPNLKNEKRQVLKGTATLYGFNINASWIYSGNLIGTYWYQDEYGRTVQTYANGGRTNLYSLFANYHYGYKRLTSSIMLGGGYTYKEMPQEEKQEDWTVNLSGMVGYTFKNQLNIGMNVGYLDHFQSGYSVFYRPRWVVGCSMQKRMFKERVELEIRYTNLTRFDWETEQKINAIDFNMVERTMCNYLPLHVKISCRLGSFKVKPEKKIRRGVIIDDVIAD